MPDNPRILIIEEHTALRAMLFAVLRHQSLSVDTAASTHEALEHISTCDYALILIEFMFDKDLQEATQDLRDAIALVRADLPVEMKEPIIRKMKLYIGFSHWRTSRLKLSESPLRTRSTSFRSVLNTLRLRWSA